MSQKVGRKVSGLRRMGAKTDGESVDLGIVKIYYFTSAITSGVTAVPSTADANDIAMTTNATGVGLIFYAVGGVWTTLTNTSAVPVVATGAEVNTGTDNAKFVSSQALKDADAAKAAGTPTTGDYFYYRNAAGVPKKILFTDLATLINV